ncbi:MAG TPA: hypothetical protein VIU62_21790 [Chloroflexota bacterium]|jgi:hypothetical protein
MKEQTHRVARVLAVVGALALLALARPAAPHARAQQVGSTLRGSTTGVYGPVALHAGLVVVRAKSNGTENFGADLINQDPTNPTPVTQDPYASQDNYSLFNDIGRFDGAATAILKQDDNYYVSVSGASGPFEFSFEQPTPATAAAAGQGPFSGQVGEHVTPYFRLATGEHTVTAQPADADTVLKVKLYYIDDLGGGAIVSDQTGYYGDELIDTSFPPFYRSVTVTVPADGVYLLFVDSEGGGSGRWTVSVQ